MKHLKLAFGKYAEIVQMGTAKADKMRIEYSYYPNGRTIWDAYKQPSTAKQTAYVFCLRTAFENNGTGTKVTGTNRSIFGFMWVYTEETTGQMFLIKETPTYRYATPIFKNEIE